jgi:hypothetical protein
MAEIHAGLRFASLSLKFRWHQSQVHGPIDARFSRARLPEPVLGRQERPAIPHVMLAFSAA